jgi:hypothetical protein
MWRREKHTAFWSGKLRKEVTGKKRAYMRGQY